MLTSVWLLHRNHQGFHMRSWSAKWLIIASVLQCIACGADLPARNPFTIAGQVNLRGLPDGGSEVQVSAVVHRPLADGGSVAVLDAGVALNGVPLGPGDPADEMTGHLFQLNPPPPGSQPPETLRWTRPFFPGAGYELRQTLSVVGSFPEATATFTCPVAVSFTTPPEGTSLSRGQPIRIGWTSGGSSFLRPDLRFSERHSRPRAVRIRTLSSRSHVHRIHVSS